MRRTKHEIADSFHIIVYLGNLMGLGKKIFDVKPFWILKTEELDMNVNY